MAKKQILVYVLLTVLLAAAGFLLLHLERNKLQDRELVNSQLRLNAVAEVVHSVEDLRDASRERFDEHLKENIRFMTTMLADEFRDGVYAGPVLFEDGAVVELRGDEAVWPENYPAGFPKLSTEELRAGSRLELEVPSGADGQPVKMVFMTGQIAENWYYVDWTEETEITSDVYAGLSDETFIEVAEEALEGTLLLVNAADPDLPLPKGSDVYPEAKTAAELGFTQEIIAERRSVVKVKGVESLCTYAETRDGGGTIIFVQNLEPIVVRGKLRVAAVMVATAIILATLAVYIFSVQNYVQKHQLSRALLNRYKPDKFRRIVLLAGITGALAVFLLTGVFQAMDTLHDESIVGAKSINRLFEYLQTITKERYAYNQESEADWDVYYGNRIAAAIARRPEAGSREKLQQYCDILGIDFIMLFDSDGKETATNSNFAGWTMDAGLGEDSSDFRRLLKGIPSIVHDVSKDPMTGLTRQMVGVTMPSSGAGDKPHGALIMALVPRMQIKSRMEMSEQFVFLNTGGRLCFFADQTSGEIMYSSDPALIGSSVQDCGLPEKSLQNGYTDFNMVNGVSSYVTTVRQTVEPATFYYIITNTNLFGNILPASCFAVIAFVVIATIILTIAMQGYDNDQFVQWVGNPALPEEDALDREELREARKNHNYAELLMSSKDREGKWEDKSPEYKAGSILKIDVLLLVLVPALFLSNNGTSFSGFPMLKFILFGDWMRGVNLFAFTGIITVATASMLILLLCNVLLSLVAGFSGKGTETVCRVLYSLARYVAILTIIYYVFEYLGLSMSTYVASLGMVSLALSLGSRDMVSDIMAGIMILFERSFQVGDIVELDGCRGKVMELGIRSTKLLCNGSDIRFISNSSIRTIVNKSKRFSAFTMDLSMVTSKQLEEVEELFRQELPAIGKKTRKIKSDLVLAGITKVTGGGQPDRDKTVSVRIRCECREMDWEDVRDYITREIYLLCEREHIELR